MKIQEKSTGTQGQRKVFDEFFKGLFITYFNVTFPDLAQDKTEIQRVNIARKFWEDMLREQASNEDKSLHLTTGEKFKASKTCSTKEGTKNHQKTLDERICIKKWMMENGSRILNQYTKAFVPPKTIKPMNGETDLVNSRSNNQIIEEY